MTYATVLLERRDAIGFVTLNRPEVLNALNRQLIRETRAALEELEADASIRVVILRGAGEAFCSGDDLGEDFSDVKTTADAVGVLENLQNVTRVLMRMPKPVMAAVHGHVVGAGCEWSMNCDLVVAADDTRFAFTEARWGYTVTNAGTKLLPQLIGLQRAKELVFTTDKFDAAMAERWGLVNYVVPLAELDRRVLEFADKLLRNSSLSIALGKRAMNAGVHMSYEDVLAQEVRDALIAARSPETAERVAGALDKLKSS